MKDFCIVLQAEVAIFSFVRKAQHNLRNTFLKSCKAQRNKHNAILKFMSSVPHQMFKGLKQTLAILQTQINNIYGQ